MEKNQKDMKAPDPSEFCGDGSCGCGCGELVEIRSSSGEESKKAQDKQVKK